MKRTADKGFTLIELLIVIVILGVLAAVVVFSVGGIRGTAEKNACLTERKTILTAIDAYKVEMGGDPNTADLVPTYLQSNPTYFTVALGKLENRTSPGMPDGCSAPPTTTLAP